MGKETIPKPTKIKAIVTGEIVFLLLLRPCEV